MWTALSPSYKRRQIGRKVSRHFGLTLLELIFLHGSPAHNPFCDNLSVIGYKCPWSEGRTPHREHTISTRWFPARVWDSCLAIVFFEAHFWVALSSLMGSSRDSWSRQRRFSVLLHFKIQLLIVLCVYYRMIEFKYVFIMSSKTRQWCCPPLSWVASEIFL